MRRGGMGGGGLFKGACVWCYGQGGGHLCFLKSERLFDEIQYILAWDLNLQSTGVTGAKIYSKLIRVRHSLDDKI